MSDHTRVYQREIRELRRMLEMSITRPTRASTEDVTVRENAKHELQVEITAVRQDGETLADTAARALSVFKAARTQLDEWYPAANGDGLGAKLEESVRRARS